MDIHLFCDKGDDWNMKHGNETLVLTVVAKGRLEAVDGFLDTLEQLQNLELHGDYKRIRNADRHGLDYYTKIIVVVRPEEVKN